MKSKMTGVIILNYNNAPMTIECMTSLEKVNSAPIKYIVVDNASTDESYSILQKYIEKSFPSNSMVVDAESDCEKFCLPYVTLVCAAKNEGYARGNNFGLALAEKDDEIDTVLIVNNDILFIGDIIPTLVNFALTNENAGLVSPLLFGKDGKTIDYNCARKDCTLRELALWYLFYCRDRHGIITRMVNERKILLKHPELMENETVPVELPSGSCMLIRKSLFKKIGYFDPNTFLYYEENILYQKLRREGKTNYLLPALHCIHLGAQTTMKTSRNYGFLKDSNKSAYYYFTHYRNLSFIQRIAFAADYAQYRIQLYIRQQSRRLLVPLKV